MTKISRKRGQPAQIGRTLTPEEFERETGVSLEGIEESLQKLRENEIYLEKNWERFLKRYPNRFVVVVDCKVVGTGKNLIRLFERLRKKNIDLHNAACEYLDPNPKPLILVKRVA